MAKHIDSTPSSRPAPASLSDIIAHHGFAVVTIGYGDCSAPGCRCAVSTTPWAYTVGLTSLGLPEFVVVGRGSGPDEPMDALHEAACLCLDGLAVTEPGDHAFADIDIRVSDVPDRWVLADRDRMAAWFFHYGREQTPVVLQILLPDRDGYFPDDAECSDDVRRRQPVLRDNPLRYPKIIPYRNRQQRRRR